MTSIDTAPDLGADISDLDFAATAGELYSLNTTTGDVSGYYIDSEDASTYQYNVKSITVTKCLGLSGSTVVGFYATNGYLWVLTQVDNIGSVHSA